MKIYTRSAWGAKPPKGVSRCAYTKNVLWVHHSESPAPTGSLESSIRAVQNIQAFHQGPARGWNDIGYAYLVDPQGRIFEGRGRNVWSAHCPGHNDEPSVCMLGSYATMSPTPSMRESIWELADYLGMTELKGHRQGYSTSCPGDEGMRFVVNRPRALPAKPDITPRPYGNTLRLVLTPPMSAGRMWAGWDECAGPLKWIVKNGIAPSSDAVITWRGNVWRGPQDVANVAASLVKRFL